MRRAAFESFRPRRGYTLLEMLVATSLLVLLGSGVVALLRQGIGIWRRAENRGLVFDEARMLLEQIAEDLRSAVLASNTGDREGWVRFICDSDALGRQRLRFVRSTPGETADPLLRRGGEYPATRAPRVLDGVDDRWEAREGLLAAPGGLMEVLYALDPRPEETTLWRGVRSPIGGADTFFSNVALAEAVPARRASHEVESESSTEAEGPAVPFGGRARALAGGIIFLGFGFWGPTTNTWDPSALPLIAPRRGQASGPLLHWDSTRALLDYTGAGGELVFRAREGSLSDPSDDIFPERVEVTLVVRDRGESLFLAAKVDASALTLELSRPISLPVDPRNRFIRVREEWIAIEDADGRLVRVQKGGRGVRDSRAESHAEGSRVDVGVTFRRVVELPRAWSPGAMRPDGAPRIGRRP